VREDRCSEHEKGRSPVANPCPGGDGYRRLLDRRICGVFLPPPPGERHPNIRAPESVVRSRVSVKTHMNS
jgi:hypothetical protein